MQLEILVLDTDCNRQLYYSSVYNSHNIHEARSVSDFKVFTPVQKYHIIHLDYDLDHDMYTSEYIETGLEALDWFVSNIPSELYPDCIVLHSLNPIGNHKLKQVLDNVNIPYYMIPCGSKQINDFVPFILKELTEKYADS